MGWDDIFLHDKVSDFVCSEREGRAYGVFHKGQSSLVLLQVAACLGETNIFARDALDEEEGVAQQEVFRQVRFA